MNNLFVTATLVPVHLRARWDNVAVFMPLPSMAAMDATPWAQFVSRFAWTPRVGAGPFSGLVSIFDEIGSRPG
jgi:hypothetical protein